jgi:putative transcriptional regulator
MSKIGREIIDGLKEALAHAEGDDVPGIRVHHFDVAQVDTRAIRKKLRLTQEQMARALGTSPSGYRKWEQGQRQPSGAAKTLLRVMEKEPEAVLRALSAK